MIRLPFVGAESLCGASCHRSVSRTHVERALFGYIIDPLVASLGRYHFGEALSKEQREEPTRPFDDTTNRENDWYPDRQNDHGE